jgi:hypothetical protein
MGLGRVDNFTHSHGLAQNPHTIAKKGICTCTHEWHEEAEELHVYIFICFEVILKKMHLTLNKICNINWWFSSHQALGISDISGYN